MKIEDANKEYSSDGSLVYSCQYHVIFTTKYRRKVLSEEIQTRLKELVLEQQKKYFYQVLEIEVMPDHIHLLLNSNPKIGINNQINHIKGYTSRILRSEFKSLRTRIPTLWTRSKFISSVGSVSLEVVKKYIENQKNV
jgi:putative transposase